ncbi:hypothetical protein BC826DRAFT_727605 [Russula brevipes]|nr:hypothetical protein BC826DRAFT_727605 [Russula brevipes]
MCTSPFVCPSQPAGQLFGFCWRLPSNVHHKDKDFVFLFLLPFRPMRALPFLLSIIGTDHSTPHNSTPLRRRLLCAFLRSVIGVVLYVARLFWARGRITRDWYGRLRDGDRRRDGQSKKRNGMKRGQDRTEWRERRKNKQTKQKDWTKGPLHMPRKYICFPQLELGGFEPVEGCNIFICACGVPT